MRHAIRLVVCVVLILLVHVAAVWAQATAQINGTVADTSGGVLPGATVVVTQTDTAFRREAHARYAKCCQRCCQKPAAIQERFIKRLKINNKNHTRSVNPTDR